MASAEVSLLPLLVVLAPSLTAAVVIATRRNERVRDAALVVGAVLTFALVASLVPSVLAGEAPITELFELMPGMALSLKMDGMALVFALLAAFLWVLASPYAIGYLRGDAAENQTRFMAFYALCLSTAFGVAMAADLLTFFIFYELLTIATYPLVTHKGDAKAIAAGRRYLGYLVTGGALVLLATTIVYQQTGELAFRSGGFVGDAMTDAVVIVAFLLFAIGFGTKAGLMPLHAWLPAAMVAPTPVSALLHAVAVVKAGVFAFGRLIGFVFGPDVLAGIGIHTVLSVVAATTIVVASFVALRQDHLKRRLAYSTIAHLAYIVLGFSLLSATAFEGSLLHIVNHGILKITLFFAAGALHVHLHLDHVSELDGVGRRMPFTMGAFALASLGLAGLPLMGGFLSKWHLVLGAYEGGSTWAALVMTGSGLLTAGYLFPVVHRAFFRPSPDRTLVHVGPHDHGHAEATASAGGWRDADPRMVLPLVTTAGVGLLLGLGDLFGVYALADMVAAAVFGAGG
jgi:formate hydrogenlyase subunit 3/multisubunit Na+/H+ antiporter MnhD subunit